MQQIANFMPALSNSELSLNIDIHLYNCFYYYTEQEYPPLEELPQTQLTNLQQIQTAFQSVKQLLFDFNQESSPSSLNQEEYREYLQQKRKIFVGFYGIEEKDYSSSRISPWLFDLGNLKTVFDRLSSVLKLIAPIIKKKYGANNSGLKIEGFLLLETIQELLTQIRNAAFPYHLYQNKEILNKFGSNWYQKNTKYLKEQQKQKQTFSFKTESYISHSIVELGYQIQLQQGELSKQQSNYRNVNQHISSLQNLTNQKLKLLQFQLRDYYRLSYLLSLQSDKSLVFIQGEPLMKLSFEQIQQLKTSPQLRFTIFDKMFIFHRHMIKNIQINQKQSNHNSSQNISNECSLLYSLLQIWLQLTGSNPPEALVTNYFALLKIIHQTNLPFIQQRQENIYLNLKIYTKQLADRTLDQHFGIIQKIIAYDQDLTYQLLTTPKIMNVLLQQQSKIKELIQEFTPLLQFGIQLATFTAITDKFQFISQVLKNIQSQVGLQAIQRSLMAQSRFKLKTVISSIDTILSVDLKNQSLEYIKPYLKELKYIMMLLQALQDQIHHKNINKSQHEQYNNLEKVAQYFTVPRKQCPIYQLKAQLLLFIALFKLGYHSPKYKDNINIINLKTHIVNLYSKIYNHNQNQKSVLLSRIDFDLMQRKSSNQHYYHYDPTFNNNNNNNQSSIWDNPNPQTQIPPQITLIASYTLSNKLDRFIKNICNNMNQMKTTCKLYLANMMNLLQNQLFIQQKQHNKGSQQILASHYIEHVRKGLELGERQEICLAKIFQMEAMFYCQRYQDAWKMLVELKEGSQLFDGYLQEITKMVNSHSLLKFMRVYGVFTKMNHLFFKGQPQIIKKNLQELISAINSNTLFPIHQKSITKIYQICMQAKRLEQLQLFFKRHQEGSLDRQDNNYKQSTCCLDELNIKTFKGSKTKKQLILVKIGKQYQEYFKELRMEINQYYLLNNSGVARISQIKEQEDQLWIQIQSNFFYNLRTPLNRSVIMIKNDDYNQNDYQRLTRNFASCLIQTYHLFNVKQTHQQKISISDITFDSNNKQFNINPFFMLIQHSLRKLKGEQIQPQKSNKLLLADLLEEVIKPIQKQFSPHFLYNFTYLIQKLRNNYSTTLKYSSLLELPLFMTLHQKEMFLVFFDNKMSEMCDEYFNKQRQLKKQRKYSQLRQARIDAMKNGIFKNHRFNFIISGIVEKQMIDLRICQNANFSKLDWLSHHDKLKISYQVPKNDRGQIKQRAYSLNCLMQCLRGAIAHKMDHSYEIILSFNEEYPQLIDFLYHRKSLLNIEYDHMIQVKDTWLQGYFSSKNDHFNKEIKDIINSSKVDKRNSQMVDEAIQILKQYCQHYQKNTIGHLKSARVKCDRCNKVLKIVGYSAHLIDFIVNCSKTMQKDTHLLSSDHTYHNCYLASTFKNHRQIKIFGDRVKQSQVKNNIVLNWWFYLQTQFPCLVEMLNRIRYKIK